MLTHGGECVEFSQSLEGPNRIRIKVKVDLLCIFKLGHLPLRSKHPKFSDLWTDNFPCLVYCSGEPGLIR